MSPSVLFGYIYVWRDVMLLNKPLKAGCSCTSVTLVKLVVRITRCLLKCSDEITMQSDCQLHGLSCSLSRVLTVMNVLNSATESTHVPAVLLLIPLIIRDTPCEIVLLSVCDITFTEFNLGLCLTRCSKV